MLLWLRERENLSQGEAAQRAQLSDKTVAHYEKGRIQPSVAALNRLLLVYGVATLSDLAAAAARMRAEAAGTEVREAEVLYRVEDLASRDDEIARLRAELDEANRAVRKAVLGAGMISVGRDEG